MTHRIMNHVKWICIISILLVSPATASAQGDGMIIIALLLQQLNKVADLSLGFSMANPTNSSGGERVIPIGIQGTISGHSRISFEIDLAFQGGKSARQNETFYMFEYLFGPRFNSSSERTTVYGHVLAGGVHRGQDGPGEVPLTREGGGFALAFGGGFDVNVHERIAIRVAQIDWIPFREGGCWKKDTVRFGFGVVFKSAN